MAGDAHGKRPVVDRAEQGLDVVAYQLVKGSGLGPMAPIDAGRGAVCGRRGGSRRPTPRCRLTSEPLQALRPLTSQAVEMAERSTAGILDLAFRHADSPTFEGEASRVALACAVWGPLIVGESAR